MRYQYLRDQLKAAAEPVMKYDGTWKGKKNLAPIDCGQDLMELFFQYSGSRPIKSVQLLAKSAEGGKETWVSVNEMINDKFPETKPIDLYMEVEQGPDRKTDDDIGGEEINPAQTTGQVMFNVYLKGMEYLEAGEEVAMQRLMDEVDVAYKAAYPPPPPPAAHAESAAHKKK